MRRDLIQFIFNFHKVTDAAKLILLIFFWFGSNHKKKLTFNPLCQFVMFCRYFCFVVKQSTHVPMAL